mmetsp:Transcript_35087/g.84900  ORF Transcript_35087/g.84900 Transcript_35087/m.84900 type:complete len:207 (+) Transcript_35087:360-980(+)
MYPVFRCSPQILQVQVLLQPRAQRRVSHQAFLWHHQTHQVPARRASPLSQSVPAPAHHLHRPYHSSRVLVLNQVDLQVSVLPQAAPHLQVLQLHRVQHPAQHHQVHQVRVPRHRRVMSPVHRLNHQSVYLRRTIFPVHRRPINRHRCHRHHLHKPLLVTHQRRRQQHPLSAQAQLKRQRRHLPSQSVRSVMVSVSNVQRNLSLSVT